MPSQPVPNPLQVFDRPRVTAVWKTKGPEQNLRPRIGPRRCPIYAEEGREGTLREFHGNRMGVREACRRLQLFPSRNSPHRWLHMEKADEFSATEMPGRAARMHAAPQEADWRD